MLLIRVCARLDSKNCVRIGGKFRRHYNKSVLTFMLEIAAECGRSAFNTKLSKMFVNS